jgi:hypothetical protein
MGVVETIHATHDILRQAREQKRQQCEPTRC